MIMIMNNQISFKLDKLETKLKNNRIKKLIIILVFIMANNM